MMTSSISRQIQIKRLNAGDVQHLRNVADGVFDNPVRTELATRFLNNAQNVLIVAFAADMVVGMASGIVYVHPDKEPELWVNELGVAPAYRRRGVARDIMAQVQSVATEEKCTACWLLTERTNLAANGFYQSLPGWDASANAVMYEKDLSQC